MSIGVDIVDLAAVPAMDAQRIKRYCEKVCNAEETEFILGADDSQNVLWQCWALKEAIYKCTFNSQLPKAFCAREINVPIAAFNEKMEKIAFRLPQNLIYLTLSPQDEAIIASASFQKEVELQLISYQNRFILYKTILDEAAIKWGVEKVELTHEHGQPKLRVSGFEKQLTISIAHHGRYAIWGF